MLVHSLETIVEWILNSISGSCSVKTWWRDLLLNSYCSYGSIRIFHVSCEKVIHLFYILQTSSTSVKIVEGFVVLHIWSFSRICIPYNCLYMVNYLFTTMKSSSITSGISPYSKASSCVASLGLCSIQCHCSCWRRSRTHNSSDMIILRCI